jgi:hypothetical protein
LERLPSVAETPAARDAPTTRTTGRPHYGGAVSPIRFDQMNHVVGLVAALSARGVPVQQQPYDAFPSEALSPQ